MKYYVYYTYKIDEPNKAYVGMTKNPTETGYKGSGTIIIQAISKYGTDNFIRINLGEFEDKDECHYWEGFYIQMYKTELKYGGYNLHCKGGGYNCWCSELNKHINKCSSERKARHKKEIYERRKRRIELNNIYKEIYFHNMSNAQKQRRQKEKEDLLKKFGH